MQLTCPSCAEPITAEHINIQQMTAVCPACHTVFKFDAPEEKAKRRKVKQPDNVTVNDDDGRLRLSFRTNFRLDRSEAFIGGAIGSVMTSFIALLVTEKYFTSDIPFLVPIMIGVITLSMYYWLALTVLNKTHIEMDERKITVARKPLPNLSQHSVDLSGVVAIRCEETVLSAEQGYDTPRFRVFAETVDGRHRTIITDLTEDYAYFVQQRLQEQLHITAHEDMDMVEDADVSRLMERDVEVDEGVLDYSPNGQNESRSRK